MKRVIVESPRGGDSSEVIERNHGYAAACLHDCHHRGETPFAAYLYTPDILPGIPEEIKYGMDAALVSGKTVVYIDLGLTPDMIKGMERAIKAKRLIEYRSLGPPWQQNSSCEIVQHY